MPGIMHVQLLRKYESRTTGARGQIKEGGVGRRKRRKAQYMRREKQQKGGNSTWY
jgi:hypothetical protein